MAYGIRAVTKNSPCPICGKPDWCGFMPADDGGELVICQRDTEEKNVIGQDGNFYVFVALSRSGNSIFEEANQRLAKEQRRNSKKEYDKSSFSKFKAVPPKTYTVLDEVKPKSNEELNKIYNALLDMLVLDDIHKQYLLNEGWTEELIMRHKIKSFPEKDLTRFMHKNNPSKNPYRKTLAKQLIEKFGENCLLGVPGAYKNSKGDWTFAGAKGILFPVYDAKHNLYRLRIRMDFMDVNEKLIKEGNSDPYYFKNGKKYHVVPLKGIYTLEDGKKVFDKNLIRGKYRNFSSFHADEDEYKKGFIVNSYNSGCEAGNQLGIYYNSERDNMYIAFVTEGEKKGIFCNDKMRAPFINVPGVNSWSKLIEGKKGSRAIDILYDRGVGMFVIAYDADKAVNSKVLESEKNAIQALRDEGFAIGIAEWDMRYGKGIDDLLQGGHQPTYNLV